MPPSNSTSMRPPTALTTSGRARIDDAAPSSCRPPWLETTIASAPLEAAIFASSASRIPFRISLPPQRFFTHSTSFQLSVGSNWPAIHCESVVRLPVFGMRPSRLPTADEIAEVTGIEPDEVDSIKRSAQAPVSLEKPVGDEEESEFGQFIADERAESPYDRAAEILTK